METARDQTFDRNGGIVRVGTVVRLLSIPHSVFVDLPEREVAELRAMIGANFVVDEIDEWGNAWITNLLETAPGEYDGHGLALAPAEMEVVVGENQ